MALLSLNSLDTCSHIVPVIAHDSRMCPCSGVKKVPPDSECPWFASGQSVCRGRARTLAPHCGTVMPRTRQRKQAFEMLWVQPGAPLGADCLSPREPVPVFALSQSCALWDLGISSMTPGIRIRVESNSGGCVSIALSVSPPCSGVDLDSRLPFWS